MAPRTRGKEEVATSVAPDATSVNVIKDSSDWAQVAKKYWLKSGGRSAKVKIKGEILKKEIYDVLEKEDFAYWSLQSLENLQILDRLKILTEFGV